jgi:diguanylate cyclase (GGDEF)-like protein
VVRAVLRNHLEEGGYTVVEAPDGEAALEVCRRSALDTVLLDIEMPGLDGHEVLRRLKASPASAGIPVVFLTGRSGTRDMVAGLQAGAHDYLRKPFEPAELLARVGAAVRTKRLQDELRQRNAELDRISRIDGLTGVYNRRHLEEHLRHHANDPDVRRTKLSVVVLDIDHFKRVNDTAGHAGGDAVLREFAQRLRAELRLSDVAGRWGGEEFLVILPGADLAAAGATAERIRVSVAARPVVTAGLSVPITVSAGCACGPASDPEDLIRRADDALYRAKDEGRNRVVAAEPTDTPSPVGAAGAG